MAALLATALLVIQPLENIPVYAADGESPYHGNPAEKLMNLQEPSDFNEADAKDPYGYGTGVPFMLSEQNELFVWKSFDVKDNLANYSATIYDTLNSQTENTGNVFNAFQTSTSNPGSAAGLQDFMKQHAYVQAVSFDPTGSGRKDHIA